MRAIKITPSRRPSLFTISRNRNSFWFSGFTPDTTVGLALRTPMGVPLFSHGETRLQSGSGVYHLPRAWHEECRIFLDGQKEGVVSCREQVPGSHGITRRLLVSGLKNATVRFYPVPGAEMKTTFLARPVRPYMTGDWKNPIHHHDERGSFLELHDITDTLLISW